MSDLLVVTFQGLTRRVIKMRGDFGSIQKWNKQSPLNFLSSAVVYIKVAIVGKVF